MGVSTGPHGGPCPSPISVHGLSSCASSSASSALIIYASVGGGERPDGGSRLALIGPFVNLDTALPQSGALGRDQRRNRGGFFVSGIEPSILLFIRHEFAPIGTASETHLHATKRYMWRFETPQSATQHVVLWRLVAHGLFLPRGLFVALHGIVQKMVCPRSGPVLIEHMMPRSMASLAQRRKAVRFAFGASATYCR